MESNKTLCKVCNELKDRIQDGTYPNSKNKKWKDVDGKLWAGKCCPSCHARLQAEFMKYKRGIKKEGSNV